jgi:tetratricopeptide (TPR) repeat protein
VYRYGSPYYQLHPLVLTLTQSLLRGRARLDSQQKKVCDSVLVYAQKFADGTSDSHDRLAADMDLFLAAAHWAAEQGDRDVAHSLSLALVQAGDFVSARGYVYELLLLRRLGASSTSAFPAYSGERPAPVPAAEDEREGDDAGEPDEVLNEPPARENVSVFLASVAADDAPLVSDRDEDIDEDEPDDEDMDDEDLDEDEDLIDEFEDDELDDDLDDDLIDDDLIDDDLDDEDLDDDDLDEDDDLDDGAALDDAPAERAAAQAPLPFDTPAAQELREAQQLRSPLIQAKQTGDKRQQADILRQIGQTHERNGLDNEAIASFSEALPLYEAINDSAGILATLEALARLTLNTDNTQAAVLHANRGIALAEQRGSDAERIRLLLILGDARQQLGETEQAARAYGQALEAARNRGDAEGEMNAMLRLGYAQLDSGDPVTAIRSWERALDLATAHNRRDQIARLLSGLGTAHGEMGRWNEAIEYYTRALGIAREIQDADEELLQLGNLGYANVQAKQLGQAVLRYRQALHLAFQANNRENIVSLCVDLARLLVESPRHLSIAEMIVDTGLELDPSDRDLRKLKERIEDERDAVGDSVAQKQVMGTAREYAANAYAQLAAAPSSTPPQPTP